MPKLPRLSNKHVDILAELVLMTKYEWIETTIRGDLTKHSIIAKFQSRYLNS